MPRLPAAAALVPALALAGLALSGCMSIHVDADNARITTRLPVSGDRASAQRDVAELATMLAGPWTSAELAARDRDYLDIRSVNVRIWQTSAEMSGAWFYTESARPSAPDTPYRQNVFNLLAQEDGSVHAYQYRVRDPARFAGAALRNEPPEALGMDDLIPLPGCTLVWRRAGPQRFEGAMRPRECRNTFRGATWMDGSSWAEPGRFYTWDRGMNDAGEQIWGPTRAGYVFTRAER